MARENFNHTFAWPGLNRTKLRGNRVNIHYNNFILSIIKKGEVVGKLIHMIQGVLVFWGHLYEIKNDASLIKKKLYLKTSTNNLENPFIRPI